MKKIGTIIILSICLNTGFSQTTTAESSLKTQKTDLSDGWNKGGVINFNISQVALKNWAAGGEGSVATNGLLSVFAHYKKGSVIWENYFDIAYGVIKQGENADWKKTDDKIDITSKYGKQAFSNWYYAGLLNFKTQMTAGYNYPDVTTEISNLFAPAYVLGAIGLDYKAGDKFSAFIAPLTLKTTIVNDQALADAAAFGVDAGEHIKNEIGGYLRLFYKEDIMENITLQSKLDLFSNYLENPEFVDVNLEVLLAMKINKYISASLAAQLIYDHDIVMEGETKAKTQFKEVLGVGISYKI